jgi:hypothetical protein
MGCGPIPFLYNILTQVIEMGGLGACRRGKWEGLIEDDVSRDQQAVLRRDRGTEPLVIRGVLEEDTPT